jgi:drug/metabolite transporter (DMT)-like permease
MNTLIALLSAFSAAGYFVYVSYVMKREPRLSSGLVLSVGHIVSSAALIPLYLYSRLDTLAFFEQQSILLPLFYAALLLVVSRQLYYYAYSRTDVANITVFSALTPVYALGAGYVILGEVPSMHALMGLLLICGSIYAMFLKRNPDKPFIINIISPFTFITHSRPVAMAFLSTIPTAFAAVYQKKLLITLDPVTFSIALLSVIGLLSLGMEFLRKTPAHVVRNIALLPWHFYFASAILLAATHVLFCIVMQHQQTAISLVLQRSAIVFQILLAYFLLKEKNNIGKRVCCAFVIMAGFMMIMRGA